MDDNETVYHDNMKQPPEKQNGLICWLDVGRPCGPDCMAYASPPAVRGDDYDDKQWASCMVLTSLRQGAKHIAVVAQHLVKQTRTAPPPKTSVG